MKQLVIKLPDTKGDMPDFGVEDAFTQIKTIPVEDIGVVVLDHPQITITQGLIDALLQNNCAVDKLVFDLLKQGYDEILDKGAKSALLSIPTLEVRMNGERRPLMIAVGHTTSSLVKCFEGSIRRILYPSI